MAKYLEGVKPSRLNNRRVSHPSVKFHSNMLSENGLYTLADCQGRAPKRARKVNKRVVEIVF